MLITLKNGQREFENGMTPLEIAGQLSQDLKKQALCARVEAIVAAAPGEGGWGKAIGEVKDLQLRWRDIGFVPRKDADAVYARFREASDALFA